jgi:hypothetical protein
VYQTQDKSLEKKVKRLVRLLPRCGGARLVTANKQGEAS